MVRDQEKKHQQKVLVRDGGKSVVLRTFSIGDKVLVYNTLISNNDIGEVTSVQGRNTYKVRVGEREKLVSADHMSSTEVSTEQGQSVDKNETPNIPISDNEDSDSDEDVPHIISDIDINNSIQSDIIPNG